MRKEAAADYTEGLLAHFDRHRVIIFYLCGRKPTAAD
jgi:hypothetical protein